MTPHATHHTTHNPLHTTHYTQSLTAEVLPVAAPPTGPPMPDTAVAVKVTAHKKMYKELSELYLVQVRLHTLGNPPLVNPAHLSRLMPVTPLSGGGGPPKGQRGVDHAFQPQRQLPGKCWAGL